VIEALRVDGATRILGLRLTVWICVFVLAGAVAWLVASRRSGGEAAGVQATPASVAGRDLTR